MFNTQAISCTSVRQALPPAKPCPVAVPEILWNDQYTLLFPNIRVALTAAEARARASELLALEPLPVAGDSKRMSYALRKSPITKADYTAFLRELLACKAYRQIDGIKVVDTPESRVLFYEGYPVISRDAATGELHSHLSDDNTARVFHTSRTAQGLCKALARTWMAEALMGHFNLSRDEMLVAAQTYEFEGLDSEKHATQHARSTGSQVLDRYGEGRDKQTGEAVDGFAIVLGAANFADHRLANNRSARLIAAIFTRTAVRSFVDAEVAGLAARASKSGSRYSFNDYNLVLRHLPLYRQVFKETPNLLPVLHALAWHVTVSLTDNAALKATASVHPPSNQQLSAHIEEQFYGLRAQLREQESCTKNEWKLISRMAPSLLKTIFYVSSRAPKHPGPLLLKTARVFRRFGLDEFPSSYAMACADFLDGLLRETLWNRPNSLPEEDYARRIELLVHLWLRHLMSKVGYDPQAKLSKREKNWKHLRFLRSIRVSSDVSEFEFVKDWLNGRGIVEGYPNSNSTFESLLSRADIWHNNIGERYMHEAMYSAEDFDTNIRSTVPLLGNPKGAGWNPVLEACEIDGVRVRGLHTSMMLATEGVEQNNCVYLRRGKCWDGSSLIFTLETPGHTPLRSTLEVSFTRDFYNPLMTKQTWSIKEIKGFGNRTAPAGHKAVAAKVVARIQALWPDKYVKNFDHLTTEQVRRSAIGLSSKV